MRPVVNARIARAWAGPLVVVRGTVFDTRTQLGFVALSHDAMVGYVTYQLTAEGCEITVLESLQERQGIGRALVEAVINTAKAAGCGCVRVVTTNDNINARRFYQGCGFRLAAVRFGAVAEARRLKPSIPPTGYDATPITDELEFALQL